MSGNRLKHLYYAHSLDDLKNKSELILPKSLNLLKCYDRMKSMTVKAQEARKNYDQELEFMYLHRYMLLLCHAAKVPTFSNKEEMWKKEFRNAEVNEKTYKKLTEKLKVRYQEAFEKSKTTPICITVYPAEDSTTNKGYSNDSRDEPIIRKITEKKQKKDEIDCFELHKLVTTEPPKETFLVMDVRPPGHFEESHIKHKNVLNVSSDKILLGLSANGLSQKFTDSASLSLWGIRGDVDKLILLDCNSSVSNLEIKSPLNHLKEILLKWDHGNYKSLPMILEGGYEELVARFPQITTNPKIKPSNKYITSVNNNSLNSFDYPMEELEPEKENIPKNTTPNLIVDRSSKPSLQKTEKSIIVGVKKSPSIFDTDGDSDSSNVISGSEAESSQPNNISHNLTDKAIKDATWGNEEKTSKLEPNEYAKKSRHESVSHPQNILGDHNRSESSGVDSKTSSPILIHDSAKAKKNNPHKQLQELRKLKPNSSIKSQSTPKDNFRNRDDCLDSEEVTFSPLKKDGGSGGLKRSSSSPNIAQMKDDPPFNRATKPDRSMPLPNYGERTDSTYGTTSAGLTGLKNFANNCYMNSILQCLNNTEALVKELTELQKYTINTQSRSKGKIAQEVMYAFRNMWSGNVRVYSIKELKTIMGNIKDIFKGTAHQDSNEFLIILLEHLHEDLKKPPDPTILDGAMVESGERAWGEFRRENCSIIQNLFYGQHKSTVTCSTCSHSSATFEKFFNLFVPIPSTQSSVTLVECIQLYMSGERISGWKCPKCDTERNATKKIDISVLPPILVIALKRFMQEEDSWLQKKENIVHYQLENLDMSRFTVAGSEQRFSKYNLYAMSIHSGTLKSGHYRAICKNYKNKKWYLFDDQLVEPLPVQKVSNNPEVYIFFYNAVTQ